MANLNQLLSLRAGIGTKRSGYAGPDLGPFRCDNCHHAHDKGHSCDQPEVIQDLGKGPNGRAKVDPKGCCNEFYPRRK